MFKHHKIVFVTFRRQDENLALHCLENLTSQFPRLTFVGRNISSEAGYLRQALSTSTLTLVLETALTGGSEIVLRDVESSLAKTPPNVILRIQLEPDSLPQPSGLGALSERAGAEIVSLDPESIENAIQRSEEVYKAKPKLSISARSVGTDGGNCNR